MNPTEAGPVPTSSIENDINLLSNSNDSVGRYENTNNDDNILINIRKENNSSIEPLINLNSNVLQQPSHQQSIGAFHANEYNTSENSPENNEKTPLLLEKPYRTSFSLSSISSSIQDSNPKEKPSYETSLSFHSFEYPALSSASSSPSSALSSKVDEPMRSRKNRYRKEEQPFLQRSQHYYRPHEHHHLSRKALSVSSIDTSIPDINSSSSSTNASILPSSLPASSYSNNSFYSSSSSSIARRTQIWKTGGMLPRRTMPPTVRSKLSFFHPSGTFYRWVILILASNIMLTAYFADQSIPTTVPLLRDALNITSSQVGALYSSAFVPNIIMTFVGGVMIDRYGTNKISMLYSTFILFGNLIFAIAPTYWGKMLGRIIAGTGFEPLEVAQDAILTRWYFDDSGKSPSLAFSYGFTFAVCQLGDLIGSNVIPMIGQWNLNYAYMFAALACIFGWITNLILVILDMKAAPVLDLDNSDEEEGPFSLRQLFDFPIQFWLLGFITMFSYTTGLCFMAFATDLVHYQFNYEVSDAARTTSLVYALSICMSPFTGWFLNKYGFYCTLMAVGTGSFIGGLVLLAFTEMTPIVGLILVGISYSLVPNSIWPSVTLVCGDEQAGTAFGGITGMNSITLLALPYAVGWILDSTSDYTYVCLVFIGFATVAMLCILLLIIVDRMKGNYLRPSKPDEEYMKQQQRLLDEEFD